MKNFLNRVKRTLKVAALYAGLATIVLGLFVTGCIYSAVDYIVNKVRGAGRWIANKYNGLVTKFKTEVLVETTEETSQA